MKGGPYHTKAMPPIRTADRSRFSKLTELLAYVCDACRRENGDTWSTVGVSGNIIDASFQALADAITYRPLKVGVAAQ